MKALCLIATLVAFASSSGISQVVCEENDQHLIIKRDGLHVLTYHKTDNVPAGIDQKYRRSGFIHPISTPSGKILTDDYPVPHHTHQHGLFFAWRKARFEGKELNFWEVGDDAAMVRHDKVLEIIQEDSYAGFRVRLVHVQGEKEILQEVWTVRVGARHGFIDFTSEQNCATDSPLVLQKCHYGAVALRGSRQWFADAHTSAGKGAVKNEFVEPCRMLTNEELSQKDGNHSRPNWVSMTGVLDGDSVAITMIPHPSNFRHPQHVRLHPSMPYFCFIPTVEAGFQMTPGKPYTSRFRIIAQDGDPDIGKLNKIQASFALEKKI